MSSGTSSSSTSHLPGYKLIVSFSVSVLNPVVSLYCHSFPSRSKVLFFIKIFSEELTNFSVRLDGFQDAFVDIVGEDSANSPIVDVNGEEELVVGSTRRFFHIVVLTIEQGAFIILVISTEIGIFLVLRPSQEDTETLVRYKFSKTV